VLPRGWGQRDDLWELLDPDANPVRILERLVGQRQGEMLTMGHVRSLVHIRSQIPPAGQPLIVAVP
jgi:hypothetical protein